MSTSDRIGISNSEIQCFRHCRRKWWLQFVRGLSNRPESELMSGPMHLGQRVHTALEAYYGHGLDPLKVELDIYNNDRLIVIERSDEEQLKAFDSDHDYAQKMLEGYLQWVEDEGIDAGYEVIAAEQEVRVPSGIDGVDLRGKLDVRMRRRSDGRRIFIDHKTRDSLETPTLEIDEQFKMYGLLERISDQDREYCDGGVMNILKRVKRTTRARPPFYRRVEVRFNDTQLRTMWVRVHAIITEMLRARHELSSGTDHHVVVYPSPSGSCAWSCPFVTVCPLFDDGSRVEDALAAHYVTVDPYGYYGHAGLEKASE